MVNGAKKEALIKTSIRMVQRAVMASLVRFAL